MATTEEIILTMLAGAAIFIIGQALLAYLWVPKMIKGAQEGTESYIRKRAASEMARALKRPVKAEWDHIIGAIVEVGLNNKDVTGPVMKSMRQGLVRWFQTELGIEPRKIGEMKKQITQAMEGKDITQAVQQLGLDPRLIQIGQQFGFDASKIMEWLPLIQQFMPFLQGMGSQGPRGPGQPQLPAPGGGLIPYVVQK